MFVFFVKVGGTLVLFVVVVVVVVLKHGSQVRGGAVAGSGGIDV